MALGDVCVAKEHARIFVLTSTKVVGIFFCAVCYVFFYLLSTMKVIVFFFCMYISCSWICLLLYRCFSQASSLSLCLSISPTERVVQIANNIICWLKTWKLTPILEMENWNLIPILQCSFTEFYIAELQKPWSISVILHCSLFFLQCSFCIAVLRSFKHQLCWKTHACGNISRSGGP